MTASEQAFCAECEELRAHLADAIRRACELTDLLHANEVAFDADTNAAVDELDRWHERALAAEADADRLADALLRWAVDAIPPEWHAHKIAVALRFCPEHGGPADDREQCRDERETADERATDGDWR